MTLEETTGIVKALKEAKRRWGPYGTIQHNPALALPCGVGKLCFGMLFMPMGQGKTWEEAFKNSDLKEAFAPQGQKESTMKTGKKEAMLKETRAKKANPAVEARVKAKAELQAHLARKAKDSGETPAKPEAKAKATKAGKSTARYVVTSGKQEFSVCEVLRWIGSQGMGPSEARAALEKQGVKPADGTINIQTGKGRRKEAPIPELPKALQEALLAFKAKEAVAK